MSQAWEKWYGDTLSEYEKQYWMTKLHFSIAGTSFYNYPYTFGKLFSLGIYASERRNARRVLADVRRAFTRHRPHVTPKTSP